MPANLSEPNIPNFALKIGKLLEGCLDTFNDPALEEKIQEILGDADFKPAIKIDMNLPYLPIEWLRGSRFQEICDTSQLKHLFRSSGTTDSIKSNSPFTNTGLYLYRASVLASFQSVLRSAFGKDFRNTTGLSLIPHASNGQQQSSLSTMISWFAEKFDVNFLSIQELQVQDFSETPCWLFCTSAHLLAILNSATDFKLNPDSFIFTTGGFKGIETELSLDELESKVSKLLGISKDRILAQYGMCELATPAWQLPGKVKLQFPSWVKPKLETAYLDISVSGIGSLIIDDPLRVDFKTPLRTQDIVEIDEAHLKILNRVPKAPLKGCSLNFTDVIETRNSSSDRSEVNCKPLWNIPYDPQDFLPKQLYLKLQKLLFTEDFLNALALELNSKILAGQAMKDLTGNFPKSFDAFQKAIKQSNASVGHILCILPNSHSIAGIEPLLYLSFTAKKITLKIPEQFQRKHSALGQILNLLVSHGIPIETIGKLNSYQVQKISKDLDFILGFGSDKTKLFFRNFGSPLNFYGSLITLSLMDPRKKNFAELFRKAIADLFCLNRLGCFSSRAIILKASPKNAQMDEIFQKISHFSNTTYTMEKSIPTKCSEAIELLEFQRKGYELFSSPFTNIIYKRKNFESLSFLSEELPLNQYIIPIYICRDFIELSQTWNGSELRILSEEDDFKRLNKNPKLYWDRIGNSNKTQWNGLHLGRPYFKEENISRD